MRAFFLNQVFPCALKDDREHADRKHTSSVAIVNMLLSALSYTPSLCYQSVIDDYAKIADQGRSDLDVVFTMILCAANFFIW